MNDTTPNVAPVVIPPEAPTAEELEQQRLERERIAAEEAAQKRLWQEREALEKEQQARTAALNEARQTLQSMLDAAAQHLAARALFQNAEALKKVRADFEVTKKSIKVDLKKCTTFIKKIRMGTYFTSSSSSSNSPKALVDAMTADVAALNLSRYVEEVVTALLESCAAVKMTSSELAVVMALVRAMHTRYADFLPNLLPPVWNAVLSTKTSDTAKARRFFVRLLTELLLHGLLSQSELQKFTKCVIEWTGGENAAPDAMAIVAFCRTAGVEVLGVVPTSVQTAMALIRQEYAETTAKNVETTTADDATSRNSPVMDRALIEEAMQLVQQLEPVLKEQRAVPAATTDTLVQHCTTAFHALSATLIQTHRKMQKLEQRCEQDRLLSGQLTAQREKGLMDAHKLCDSLLKSVEILAEALHQPRPVLESRAEEDRTVSGSGGIEVWTKEAEGSDNCGPFDDEETRSFYFDVPDLLATIPSALLGITEEELEQRKKSNAQKYRADGSAEVEEDASAVAAASAPISAEQLDAAEQGQMYDEEERGKETDKEENKDTPHYRLMLLVEQELPECNRREQIDEIAEKFATNHGSSKNARKRLLKALFLVPRSRLDLLPFYARLVATLDHVWTDIATSLVTDLAQQFHGQAKFKKNLNIEARMRTARYLGELTKVRAAPPIVILNCLERCLEDFTGNNVEIACCILESCGRYLYRTKHTNPRIVSIMEIMTRLSKAKVQDFGFSMYVCQFSRPSPHHDFVSYRIWTIGCNRF
jgi:regulator of nonsense transcripts 2